MKLPSWSVGVVVMLLALSSARDGETAEFYATAPPAIEESLLLSARPGEYYYNLGADAVRHKDYTHAVEMYQVSASWAYKTSEYNLGVMYARGEGVPIDLPRAMAWMSLAAERGDKQYVRARDFIASQLDKNGLAHAEEMLHGMLPTYGDTAALTRAKQRWHEVRDQATGSHLGFTGDVTVAGPGANSAVGRSQVGAVEEHLIEKFENPKLVRPIGQSNAGTFGVADLAGTSGVDGTTAYSDLRMTDNPYDARLNHGSATVGPIIPAGEKRAASESAKPTQTQGDGQQKP